MDRLLVEKYKFPEPDARGFVEFLGPLLDFAPEKRPTASACLQHPWLKIKDPTSEKLVTGMGKLQVNVGT